SEANGRMIEHLHANNVDLNKTPLTVGMPLMIDTKGEKFTGPDAAKANAMLTRQYRAPFIVPKMV
ncbi:MAG: gfo/Idh/MocA family oxidoreductase, partial [bacterium]